jgi:hypothetical protein
MLDAREDICVYNGVVASKRLQVVQLRVRARERIAWRAAAKRADETLSEWIRSRCNTSAAAAEPKEKTP